MRYKALLEENRLLKQANAQLQEDKRELLKINANNFKEYNILLDKYNQLRGIRNEAVPKVMRKEVSE